MNVVLLGDMVHSRKSAQRARLYAVVRKLWARQRKLSKRWIASPAARAGIDEFSAVPRSLRVAWEFATELADAVWPDAFRLAVVVGKIDLGIRSGNATAMDGTAFHIAAKLLREAEATESSMRIFVPGAHESILALVESGASSLIALRANWTPTMHATYKQLSRHTPRQLAAKLGVSPQNIYSLSRRGRFDLVRRSTIAIGDCCTHLDQVHRNA